MAVAWAAPDRERAPSRVDLVFSALEPREVEVEIEHCGLCHSDLHILRNYWGITSYPVVAGHEIVGRVVRCGPDVHDVREGDRVGIGWQRGACLACAECIAGEEQLCKETRATALGTSGGFATHVRADARFVHPIPEGMESANAAPLLCAGATVYSPLVTYGVRPTMSVGVIGIGGLGHLAIQFARAWGCEVTAFSTSADKEAEARGFGAHHFVCTQDPAVFEGPIRRSLDFVISTVNVPFPLESYLRALRPNGTLCLLGAPSAPLSVNVGLMLDRQLRIAASMIGSRRRMRDMLAFAARHGIAPKIELRPMDELAAALERLAANQARYRIVLDPRAAEVVR